MHLKTKEPFCLTKEWVQSGLSFFRLSIPPFVPARAVLEGLKSEDAFENKKVVKNEIDPTCTLTALSTFMSHFSF